MRPALAALLVSVGAAAAGAAASREVSCWSGPTLIYHGYSDPAEDFLHNAASGRLSFREKDTGRRIELTASCLVVSTPPPH